MRHIQIPPATRTAVKGHSKRFGGWWVVSLAALAIVLILAPQQGEVLVYKICQVMIALLLSYWADRMIFCNAPAINKRMPRDTLSAARLLTRALVALAIIIGLTVGI